MSDKTSDKLIQCPFCGGENIHSTYFNWTPAIRCECGAVMTVQMGFDTNKEAELVRRWNTRKPMERIVERLEEHREWTDSTFDEDGFCNDDSFEVVRLDTAIEIVKEEGAV